MTVDHGLSFGYMSTSMSGHCLPSHLNFLVTNVLRIHCTTLFSSQPVYMTLSVLPVPLHHRPSCPRCLLYPVSTSVLVHPCPFFHESSPPTQFLECILPVYARCGAEVLNARAGVHTKISIYLLVCVGGGGILGRQSCGY